MRAQKRMGEELKRLAKNKGGQPEKNRSQPATSSFDVEPTLDDIGVSKSQSSRYQKLANIPEKVFEATVAEYQQKCIADILL